MRKNLMLICKILLLALTGVLIINESASAAFSLLTFLLGVAILFVTIPLMERSFRTSSCLFIAASIVLFFFGKQPLGAWIKGTNSMLNIAAIVVVMQLFAVPIQIHKYDQVLTFIIRRYIKRESALFIVVTMIGNLFGSFLLFGTIPVLMSLLGGTLKQLVRQYERFVATALPRGQTLIGLWAPGAINILLIIQITKLQWIDVVIPGILLSLLGLLISYFIEGRTFLTSQPLLSVQPSGSEPDNPINEREAWVKFAALILTILILILLTLFFEKNNFSNSTGRVLLAGALVVSFILFFCRKEQGINKAFSDYWNTGILKAVDLSGLFISMGLFSEMFKGSGILEWLQTFIPENLTSFGFLGIALTTFSIIACSLVGIHPFISIVMVGNLMTSLPTGVPLLPLALSLALGTSISYNISPFAGIILTIAKYLDRNPFEIAFKWNGPYSLILFCLGTLLIYGLTVIA